MQHSRELQARDQLVEDLTAKLPRDENLNSMRAEAPAADFHPTRGTRGASHRPADEPRLVLDERMITDYSLHMRTTISLDDRLAEAVRRKAAEKGTSVSAFIAEVLDDALKRADQEPEPRPPFRLVTVGGPGTHEGVDLDRPRELDVAEDADSWRSDR